MTTYEDTDEFASAFNAYMDDDDDDDTATVPIDHDGDLLGGAMFDSPAVQQQQQQQAVRLLPDELPLPHPPAPKEGLTLCALLESVDDSHINAIANESAPKGKANRRCNSLTLCVLMQSCCDHPYDACASDVSNMLAAVTADVDRTLALSDVALANLLRMLNASASNRVFAAASRVSTLRCDIRTRCDTPERKEAFKRFAKIVRRSDTQLDEAKGESLARSVLKQDNTAQINKRDMYNTISQWFASGNQELGVMAVQLCTGLRFAEVLSPAVKIWAFSDYLRFCPTFADNNPPALVAAATADPEHYIVNYAQAKKKGGPMLTCIRPVLACTAKALCEFRAGLVGRTIHNRSANRRLRMSGGSLLRDFYAHGRQLTTSALRGAYIAAATQDWKPSTIGAVRFQNAILGYDVNGATAPRYQVCECN